MVVRKNASYDEVMQAAAEGDRDAQKIVREGAQAREAEGA